MYSTVWILWWAENFKNSLNSICIEEQQRIHDNYKYFTYSSAQRRDQKRNKQVHNRYINDRRDHTHNQVSGNQQRQRETNHDYREKQNNKGLCYIHALHKNNAWSCDQPDTCPMANVLSPRPKNDFPSSNQ